MDKDKFFDQWNRIESPETEPWPYGQLIFDKQTKIMKWSKEISSINAAGKTGLSH